MLLFAIIVLIVVLLLLNYLYRQFSIQEHHKCSANDVLYPQSQPIVFERLNVVKIMFKEQSIHHNKSF